MLDAGNATVAERAGPSTVVLGAVVQAGGFAYTVGGGHCSFTLTITVTPTT